MKKAISLVIIVSLLLTLSACSLRTVTESVMPTPTPAAETPAEKREEVQK